MRWCLHLFEFKVDVVHETSLKHQAVDVVLRVPTAGEGKTDFNVTFLEFYTVQLDEAKEAEENGDKHGVVSETLNAIA